ncbi:MAG: 2-C-methyl-D-erythritol 4-phosphate cytidylyltransferase [Acidimicrobiia bacterium]|nr:2-C-methyl-D-erythritol 4-phosphate cytidylyltransferase [Acidimicrobiia bacterium]NNC75251.1 NTP transferase domain-containing protein [Acidimicrobiia bacterium]
MASPWAIVVAAGSGVRFGGPKHLIELDGVELFRRSVNAVEPFVEQVVVVGDVPGGIPGGGRRRDSVEVGLAELPDHVDWVLIHDGARPLAPKDLVRRVVDAIDDGVDAVVPAIPVRDTIKRAADGVVEATIDRDGLFAAQTPQAVRVEALKKALADSPDDATDDAGLIERIGGVVRLVAGDPRNIKITYPEDLAVAAALAGFL